MFTDMLTLPNQNATATLLLVDADPSARRALRARLAPGYAVLETASGQGALRLVARNVIDLVVAQFSLPDMDGIELLQSARSVNPSMPVIIVSDSLDLDTAKRCMTRGASDYVVKPLDQSFEGKVAEALQSRQLDAPQPMTDVTITEIFRKFTNYHIERVLGAGQMGTVYLASRMTDGQLVAIKVIHSDFQNEQGVQSLVRFYNEIDLLSKLEHPNIVKIFETGYAGQEMVPYYVMEYLEGRSLRLYSTRLIDLPLSQKVQIIAGIAEALAEIHRHDVCHRDLKPDNIIVTSDLQAKLLDFGIARLPDSDVTMDNQILGTPNYFAPESFDTPHTSDRADVFSLGVVAYELLSGTKPFQGENIMQLGHEICHAQPPALRELDTQIAPAVDDIIMQMLAKVPTERPAAVEVAARLG